MKNPEITPSDLPPPEEQGPQTTIPEEKLSLLEETSPEGISRREFIKRGVISTAWLAALTGLTRCASVTVRGVELDPNARTSLEAPRGPDITLDIYFNSHRVPEDLRQMQDNLSRADGYLFEGIGHTKKSQTIYEDIADGKITPSHIIEKNQFWTINPANSFLEEQLILLYRSKKLVMNVDIPDNHPLENQWYRMRREELDLTGREMEFQERIRSFKNIFRSYAEIQQQREAIMRERLDTIARAIKTGVLDALPELSPAQREKFSVLHARKNVTLLFEIGAAHTGIYHTLKRVAQEHGATRSISPIDTVMREFESGSLTPPYIYGYRVEMIRRYLFGKEVSDELAMRAMLSTFIDSPTTEAMQEISTNTNTISRFIRGVVSKFKSAELEQSIEALRALPFKKRIDFLKERGIIFPKTEEDLEAAALKK